MAVIQVPWIILPRIIILGTEVETINDLVEHTSIEFPVEYLQEKEVHILATEVIVAGVPVTLIAGSSFHPYPQPIT